jgi:hypothetical protein
MWEKKNAQRALRGGAVSTMALTLAACGGDDDDPVVTSSDDSADDSTADDSTADDSTADDSTEDDSTADDTTPVANFMLTTNADDLTGNELNNTFTGTVQQNGEGASANSLSTGDVIDGGAGTNKLEATLINDNQVDGADAGLTVNPQTTNVQQVYISGLDEDVTLDAGRMDSVEQLWSDDSDESLIIEDVRLGDLSITKDITFGMRDVDTDAGLAASFETQSLVNAGTATANSQIIIEVGDSNKDAGTETPIDRIELELNFTFGGESYSFEDIASTDGTYAGLQEAIQTTLADAGLGGLEVTLGEAFDEIAAANDTVPLPYEGARQVVVTDPDGAAFTEFTSGVGATAGEASSNPVSDVRVVDPTESATVIETNLILDNAGRGSTAGDAIIGGMSNSDQVIEKLNLIVDRDSAIRELATASNMEDEELNNGVYQGADADVEGFDEIVLTSMGANGDVSITDINDTTTFDASAFEGGELTIGAASALQTLSADVGADVDVTSTTAAGENAYTTGGGDDTLTTTVDGDHVDTVGESFAATTNAGGDTVTITMTDGVSFDTMDELDNLSISTGAGEDFVDLDAYGTFAIETGAGSDFVRINSLDEGNNGDADAGSWTIGDPTQNVDNFFDERVLYEASLTVNFAGIEETVTVETDRNGNFIATQADVNAAIKAAIDANHELSDLLDYEDGTGNQSLTITSTVGGDNNLGIAIYQPELVAAANVTTGEDAGQDVALADGDVASIREGLIDTGLFNSADSDDAGVADIVAATNAGNNFFGSLDADGTGDETLQSTADIEGDVTEGPNTADTGGGIFQDADNLYFDLQNGGSSDSTDGSINLSSVNVGDGSNDIVSVHSGEASSNQLVIDQSFGKVTVVNWHDVSPDEVDASADQGQHALDFSAFLTDQVDTSDNDNDDTATSVNTTVNMVAGASAFAGAVSAGVENDNTADANSVNVIRFAQEFADEETFEGVDAATLRAALNDAEGDGSTDYGNLTGNLLDPANTGDLVGDTQNHIVMVENDLNEGEYKVFHLTSENDGDFSTADELGTLDFGASINVNVVGNEEYDSYLETLKDLADDASVTVTEADRNEISFVSEAGNDTVNTSEGLGGDPVAGEPEGGEADDGEPEGSDADDGEPEGGEAEVLTIDVGPAEDGKTFDAAPQDTTFDVARGTFDFTIEGFDTGDVLDASDFGGANAIVNFDPDGGADTDDGVKKLQLKDGNEEEVNVTLTGLSPEQDAAIFSKASIDEVLGEGTLII